MKQLAFSLFACLGFIPFAYTQVIKTPLEECLIEYEAITAAIATEPQFQDVIPEDEFITSMERRTPATEMEGIIRWELETRGVESPLTASTENGSLENHCGCHNHHKRNRRHQYVAILRVLPSGVTVEKIKKVHREAFDNRDFFQQIESAN